MRFNLRNKVYEESLNKRPNYVVYSTMIRLESQYRHFTMIEEIFGDGEPR